MISAIFCLLILAVSANALRGFDAIQPLSASTLKCLNNSGYNFFIARVHHNYGEVDHDGIKNLVKAHDFGLTDLEVQQVTNVNDALRAAGAEINRLWVDVESYKNGWGASHDYNRKFIMDMVNAAVGLGWNVGIYTNYNHWQTIVGANFDSLSDYPLWWSRYNGAADLVTRWSPFGGWDNPTIHQYTQNSNVCNFNIDKNYKN
uniref:Lysozyme n=1 Tax=Panagrolaimus sp. JU765 TaxID=591449 RepID=A0AC34RL37_9BILA